MKPTLFLIGIILSVLGTTIGIFYGSHWFILLVIGIVLILIKGTTNTNDLMVSTRNSNQKIKTNNKRIIKQI